MINKIAWVLVIIGGLNWLLVGALSWDIGLLFGEANNIVARVVYILVGLSALLLIFAKKSNGPAQPMA